MPAHLRLEAEMGSPARARAFARRSLADAALDTVEVVVLLVSEVVTNAVVHAHSEVLVVISRPAGRVRVEVHDHTAGLSQRPAAGDDPRGRGLKVVAALADAWGVTLTEDGKAVWFEVGVPTVGGQQHGQTVG